MPWCSKCNHYGSTVEFRRLPQKADQSILTYVCKDRSVCRARAADGLTGKGTVPRGSQPRPADAPKDVM